MPVYQDKKNRNLESMLMTYMKIVSNLKEKVLGTNIIQVYISLWLIF